MIGIIDYGSGNLRSVYNAFKYIGEDAKICEKPAALKGVDKLVLPGVGSSKDAMRCLERTGLGDAILDSVSKGKPFLGLCLGLQLLFDKSEESGSCRCLGLVRGEVKLFPKRRGLKVPQIGWNTVKKIKKDCPLFKGVEDNAFFYFVHSYYCASGEPGTTAGETEYGVRYTSVLWKENIYAMQFHPERSQKNGIKLLKNFVRL